MGIVLEQAQEADAQTVADFMDFVAGESDNLAFGVGEFVRQHSESEAVFLRQQLESGGFTLLAWNQVKGGPQLVGLLSANCETRSRSAHSRFPGRRDRPAAHRVGSKQARKRSGG